MSGPEERNRPGVDPAEEAWLPKNRLGDERSPFLQQHARDPIGWYPWGPAAFEAARREDKPLFLSIGFSSCHWCHVMERECFSDPETSELMNDACIPVCVDREERPDLDALFMEVCRLQNGSGGWPLNLFLTPDGRPFFATTWLPKRTTGQMPGITDILPRVKWLWLMQREDVLRAAEDLTALLQLRCRLPRKGRVGAAAAREALNTLRRSFDANWGGFGTAPKFPEVPKLLFLLQQAGSALNSRQERDEAFAMVDLTLRRMWRGGIHDHLGGGFARYATDERWITPHFEKLLSTQAALLLTASLAQEERPDPFYRTMAEDIVGFVVRDLSDPSPAFYTSIDSESAEGEGRYYLWRDDEVRALLPDGEAGLFCAAYAVMPGGNFGDELAGAKIGYNILYEATTVSELARRFGLRPQDAAQKLADARARLLDARRRRPAPACDAKVLMGWNGLMIGAMARASSAFERPDWRELAERTAFFLQKTLLDRKVGWLRRWRGSSDIPALAGDYAALLWGVTELHRAAVKAGAGEKQARDWLDYGALLAEAMIENCLDRDEGGLFLTPGSDANIFMRYKTAEDGDLPSANALAALALSRLGAALEERRYADLSKEIVASFAHAAAQDPVSHLSLIAASALWRPVKPKDEEVRKNPPEEPEEPATAAPDGGDEPAPEEEVRRRPDRATRHERAARHERRLSRAHRSARSRDR